MMNEKGLVGKHGYFLTFRVSYHILASENQHFSIHSYVRNNYFQIQKRVPLFLNVSNFNFAEAYILKIKRKKLNAWYIGLSLLNIN